MTGRLLITGGGGFVGSHLAAGFARLGYEVVALDQVFDAPTRARLAGLTLVEQPLSAAALASAVGAADIVVHAAAITSAPEAIGLSPTAHLARNLELLLTTLDWAGHSGARQFVFTSSSGVFTAGDAVELLTEDVVPTGASPYAVAKRCGELIVAAAHRPGFSTVSVRFGHLYGPFEAVRPTRLATSLMREWLSAAVAGLPLVLRTPAARRDWTNVEDLAAAIDRLLTASPPATGLMHLGSPEIHSDAGLAQTIAGRLPGALITTDGAARRPPKAPMGSNRRAELAGFAWTPLAAGLDRILAEEALP